MSEDPILPASPKDVLIGNTFSMTLIRVPQVTISSRSLDDLQKALRGAVIHSFWGHENTRVPAERLLGYSLKPKTVRPAICLDPLGLLLFDGLSFSTCWVLTPEYHPGFRPLLNVEVTPDQILGWQVLQINWTGLKKGSE